MASSVRQSIAKGAAWGAVAALVVALAVYAYLVFGATYPRGLEGDRFMAASTWISFLGAPTSILLMSVMPDGDASAMLYYATYLGPVALNGAVIGSVIVLLARRRSAIASGWPNGGL